VPASHVMCPPAFMWPSERVGGYLVQGACASFGHIILQWREPWRSRFRNDGDHHSDGKPITSAC
jgi:hypothetical protein